MSARPNVLERVSIHESGHFLLAVLGHIPVSCISIIPDRRRREHGSVTTEINGDLEWLAGRVDRARIVGAAGFRSCARRIELALGGPVAETELLQRRGHAPRRRLHSSRFDYARASTFARLATEDENEAHELFAAAHDHVTELVREHWAVVELIARTLLDARVLKGRPLARLLRDVRRQVRS
jgi:ATP-dependent Zn protease